MLFNFNTTSLLIFTEHQTKITRKSLQGRYSITFKFIDRYMSSFLVLFTFIQDRLIRKTNF